MATATARTQASAPPKTKKRGGKLRVVPQVEEFEQPKGDESLTREAMEGWKPGQKRCRSRKRHNWGPFTVYEHAGWYEVVEQCSHCRNRRWAPFVETGPGRLRKEDKWKPDYRDGYLLPKGAMRLTDDLQDELTYADIMTRRIVEVLDEDEES